MKVKVAGVWKDSQPKVKVAGVWKDVTAAYVKVAGVWREMYSASAFWLAEVDTTGAGTLANGRAAVDSAGNAIIVGSRSTEAFVLKISPAGEVLWAKVMDSTDTLKFQSVGVDSSDNIYIAGQNTTTSRAFVTKFTSAGTNNWQTTINLFCDDIGGIAVTSSGVIYLTGYRYSSNSFCVKMTSAGGVTWTRTLSAGFASSYFRPLGVCVEPVSGDAMIGGYTDAPSFNFTFIRLRASDGVSQYAAYHDIGEWTTVVAAGTDTFIFGGRGSPLYLTKVSYPVGGTFSRTWQKEGTLANLQPYAMTLCSDGSVIIVGYISVSSVIQGFILKVSSAGAKVWERRLSQASGRALRLSGVDVDANDNVIVTGFGTDSAFQTFPLALRLSGDGTGTGTIVGSKDSYSYASGNMGYVDSALSALSSGAASSSAGSAGETAPGYSSTTLTHGTVVTTI